MPSTYSNSLRIELIAAGEQAGTWNITTNRNLGTLLEQAIAGVGDINISAGSKELLALNGASDEARNAVLILTGTPASGVTLTVPNVDKQYTVQNRTVQPVAFKTDGGTSYTCPPNSTSTVIINAVGSGEVTGISITDDMALALGAESLADALEAMGAAPIDSPVFTGIPQGPTAARGSKTKQFATTEFVAENSVPVGAILMWSGSVANIPSGWVLCDGANGTPDLRDRFVLGAGSTYAVGAVGGSADATLVAHDHGGVTGLQNANHTHSFTTDAVGDHIHGGAGRTASGQHAFAENGGGYVAPIGNTTPAGAHSHSGVTAANNANHAHSIPTAGSSATGANMPPYYALCFIMKT